jgi:putative addiction module component (TIGR02574 family)
MNAGILGAPNDRELIMPSRRTDLETAVLELPPRERARLAHRLIESLDNEAAESSTEVERAWATEIERRVTAYRAGEIETIPASDVFEEARSLLKER